jgi:small subunit ribosomal protein S2
MLEAGVHFGHQTRRWNPKMKRYIFGKRNGIYIIDLQQTTALLEEAVEFARSLGYAGRRLLFVGTKRQAQDVVAQEAKRCGQYYVSHRWLGGMLTNFVTIRQSIDRLQEIEDRLADEASPLLKKEKIRLDREYAKTNRNLVGIRGMDGLPDALFVVDPKREHIAVGEANKLGIPVIAIVDTNCDPEEVEYVIPGNDDAIRTIRLFSRAVAEAYMEGAASLAEAIEQSTKDQPEEDDVEVVAAGGAGDEPAMATADEATEEAADEEFAADDSEDEDDEDEQTA